MLYEVITADEQGVRRGDVGRLRQREDLVLRVDEGARGGPGAAVVVRITSYNVCYTKLLRGYD